MEPQTKIEKVTIGASMDLLVTEIKEKPAEGAAERARWAPVAADTSCDDLIANATKLLGKSWRAQIQMSALR